MQSIFVTETFPTAPRTERGRVVVAAGAATVHAAVQESAATGSFTGIIQPDVPRLLSATFLAGWQGGDITITGWDADGKFQTEVIPDTAGATVNGTKVFARVNTIEKELVAGTTDTVTIGTQAANYYSSLFSAHRSNGFDWYWETTGDITSTITLWVATKRDPSLNNDADWTAITPGDEAPTAAGAANDGVSENPGRMGLYRAKYAAPTGNGIIFGEVQVNRV